MSQTTYKPFYNEDKIRNEINQVPILDILKTFNIEVESRGSTYWCKLRPERTASTKVNVDANFCYDFGMKKRYDCIGLVSYLSGKSRYEAMQFIADMFSIASDNPREGLNVGELSVWDYAKINIDGQMASRNFTFNLERQSVDRVSEISLLYAMPMNVLKKTKPLIYEKLLKQRSIPYLSELRSNYYNEILAQYHLAKSVGSEDVFKRMVENGDFADQIKELQTAERIFEHACKGTKIPAWSVGQYDPISDVEKLLSGEIKMDMGKCSYSEIRKISENEKSPLKYRTFSRDSFAKLKANLQDIPYTAFMKNGKVIVGFMEKDFSKIIPFMDKDRSSKKT